MVTFLALPRMSVNCSLTSSTLCSDARAKTSFAVVAIVLSPHCIGLCRCDRQHGSSTSRWCGGQRKNEQEKHTRKWSAAEGIDRTETAKKLRTRHECR